MRILPVQIIVYGLVVILRPPAWLLIALGIGLLVSLWGFIALNLQMWRERQKDDGMSLGD
jgi:hypothetical protein